MKAWHDFLNNLERDLGKETVDKWLRPLKILKFDATNLYLDAKDSFQILWYREHVTEDLKTPNGKLVKLHFHLKGKPYSTKKKKGPIEEAPTKEYFSPDHLASHATFENYVMDENPFLPYDLLAKVDGSCNPIFLYGPAGSGKTHLLMATAQMLRQMGKNVFFAQSETFTNHVIRAFRTNSLREFRLTYRSLDCLIIDDIQLFKRKISTQEELFHTFNYLHTRGMQIVLSANASPQLLDGIEERLKSRLEWGIVLPLPSPTPDTKKKILQRRASALSISLTEILLAYLMETFQSLKSLIRAVEALALRLHQTQLSLNVGVASYLLQDLIRDEESHRLTPEKVLSYVADYFEIKTGDILGRSQHKECALPRKIAMYFLRTQLYMSYLKIGEFFSRDHSTVMTSVKQVQKKKAGKDHAFTSPLVEIQKKWCR